MTLPENGRKLGRRSVIILLEPNFDNDQGKRNLRKNKERSERLTLGVLSRRANVCFLCRLIVPYLTQIVKVLRRPIDTAPSKRTLEKLKTRYE